MMRTIVANRLYFKKSENFSPWMWWHIDQEVQRNPNITNKGLVADYTTFQSRSHTEFFKDIQDPKNGYMLIDPIPEAAYLDLWYPRKRNE